VLARAGEGGGVMYSHGPAWCSVCNRDHVDGAPDCDCEAWELRQQRRADRLVMAVEILARKHAALRVYAPPSRLWPANRALYDMVWQATRRAA